MLSGGGSRVRRIRGIRAVEEEVFSFKYGNGWNIRLLD